MQLLVEVGWVEALQHAWGEGEGTAGGVCNGAKGRCGVVTAGGGEVLQGFQAADESCLSVGVAAR